LIWAFRDYAIDEEVVMKYHGRVNRGVIGIEITKDLGVRASKNPEAWDFYKTHGWLMFLSWQILGLLQIASNRWLKAYWRINMWIHRLSGTGLLVITLTMGIMAKQRANEDEPMSWHAIMGNILMFSVVAVALGGVFTRSRMNRLRWGTHKLLKIKRIHGVSYLKYQCFRSLPMYLFLPQLLLSC
jgi:hypothetical protein